MVLNCLHTLESSSYSHLILLFQFIKSPVLRPFSKPFKPNPGAGIQASLFWNPQMIPMESCVVSKWSAAILQKYCEHQEVGERGSLVTVCFLLWQFLGAAQTFALHFEHHQVTDHIVSIKTWMNSWFLSARASKIRMTSLTVCPLIGPYLSLMTPLKQNWNWQQQVFTSALMWKIQLAQQRRGPHKHYVRYIVWFIVI